MKNISEFDNFIKENNDSNRLQKMEKLKEMLELVSGVDIMFHDENQEYFFEWFKDGKKIDIWLGDYI